MNIQKLKDNLAKASLGITMSEAIQKEICVDCKRKENLWYSEAGKKEYFISGLCEYCFDEITGG